MREYNLYDKYKLSIPSYDELHEKLKSIEFINKNIVVFRNAMGDTIFDGSNLPPQNELSDLLTRLKIMDAL